MGLQGGLEVSSLTYEDVKTPLPPSSPKPSSGGFFFRALLYRHRA